MVTDSTFRSGIYRSIELVQGWTGYLITHRESRCTPATKPECVLQG